MDHTANGQGWDTSGIDSTAKRYRGFDRGLCAKFGLDYYVDPTEISHFTTKQWNKLDRRVEREVLRRKRSGFA
jgi:hypothetical protein